MMAIKKPTEPINAAHPKYIPQPLPDVSQWRGSFTGWSIWTDVAESDGKIQDIPRELGLGLFIAEMCVATKRILGWSAFFGAIAAILIGLAVFITVDHLTLGIFILVFFGVALYRFLQWVINYDLRVRIFREGFTLTQNGAAQTVFWRDVEYVREQWNKQSIEGIQVYTHKIEVRTKNGQIVKMGRMLQDIEKVGAIIRAASAEHLLPASIEILKNDGTLDFGTFKINRYGIIHKEKKFLPWNEVKSLETHTVGYTMIKIQKVGGGKLTPLWTSESGANILNLDLFTALAHWFIEAGKRPAEAQPTLEPFNGDVYYKLFLTQEEAREGVQKVFYVGLSGQEKKLVVKVPAGVKPGVIYRFPDHGRSDPQGKSAGVLNVEICPDDGSARKSNREAFQMAMGIVVFIAALMWLILDSEFGLLANILIAALIGCFSGILIDVKKRWVGAICGVIGGAVSFLLQFVYYAFMYVYFGRESFWNYESVIVLLISMLPGVGLYILFIKDKK